jgi:hypothetical protein
MGQRIQMVRELVPESWRAQDGQAPRGGRENPGGPGSRPVQAADGAEECGPLCTPSPSMTAMGGQDDAVVCSARLVPSARCNGSAPEPLCRATGHECAEFPLDASARAAPQLPDGRKPDWPTRQPIAVLAQSPNSDQAGEAVPPLSCAGMRSQTAVRSKAPNSRDRIARRRAFPQVRATAVGLAGLEPAASSLSGIED